jgi:RHS repeat-associated protein
MSFNSSVGIYSYPAPGPNVRQPHAAQAAGSTQLRYDANGLLSMATNAAGQMRSIDWNFDQLPTMVSDFDGTRTDYEYDAFGNLAVEAGANETVLHFGNVMRHSSVKGPTQMMLLDGKPFAEKTANGQRLWYHLDRNDALRAVSDARGTVIARSNYAPYGAPQSVSSARLPMPQRHAGAVMFGGTQLQVLGARLYDPLLGRFLGPDSVVPNPYQPQAANRYAYGYNMPLDFVDPSGHQPEDLGIDKSVGGNSRNGFDAGFHSFSMLPSSAMVASNSPTFLPPSVQQSVSTTTATDSKTTSKNIPGIFKIDWNDPAQISKYLALREYARINRLCGHCHAYTPDMGLEHLTGESLRRQQLMVAAAGVGPMVAAAAPVVAEVVGSEALLSGSIWLYMKAPSVWNFALALGYGSVGISSYTSPVPRLMPADSRTMVRQLGQVIGEVPVPNREVAVRGMLQQIAQSIDGWRFTEQAFQGGRLFIGSELPTKAIWVSPTGQVIYGLGSFRVGDFQFIWTGATRVWAP